MTNALSETFAAKLHPIVIVDMDGTVADVRHRLRHIKGFRPEELAAVLPESRGMVPGEIRAAQLRAGGLSRILLLPL